MLRLRPEQPLDAAWIEELLDAVFGVERQHKISYRYRVGLEPVRELCLIAEEEGRRVGTIRFWPVRVERQAALLLGPLAILPERAGKGIGRRLVEGALARAREDGHRHVLLVGDPAYYRRFGFRPAPAGLVMPGEAPGRLQWRGLGAHDRPPLGTVLRCSG